MMEKWFTDDDGSEMLILRQFGTVPEELTHSYQRDEAERMEGIEVWKSQSPSNHVIGFDTTHKYLSIQVTLKTTEQALAKNYEPYERCTRSGGGIHIQPRDRSIYVCEPHRW
jgi:hypothetical protein